MNVVCVLFDDGFDECYFEFYVVCVWLFGCVKVLVVFE